jgi:hypothetical protein
MPVDTAVKRLKEQRTKIVARLGPASRDADTLAELIHVGVEVFRLNFSHGSQDKHAEAYHRVRGLRARRRSGGGARGPLRTQDPRGHLPRRLDHAGGGAAGDGHRARRRGRTGA